MVHGVGSCSGGGFSGGGFSSGFSGTAVNTTILYTSSSGNRRGRRYNTRNTTNNGGDCDCRPCCSAIALTLGIGKNQTRRTRVVMISFWLFLIFGIAGLSTAFATYGSHTTDLSPTDMRPLTKGVGPTFCTGASFQSGYQLDYYLFRDTPKLATTKMNYTLKRSTYILSDNYEYWGYYLTAGSKVSVTSCVDSSATFYIVKERNWHKWQRDNYCSCTELNHYTGSCSFRPDTFSYLVQETGEYYFVWANHNFRSASVSVTFDMLRVPFDLHDAEFACKEAFSCEVSDLQTGSQVVAYVPDLKFQDSVYITAQCHREVGVFLAIFLCIPLSISLITGILIYFVFCKKKTNKGSTTQLTAATSQNLTDNSSSSTPVISKEPKPKNIKNYSSLDSSHPPSYAEAVAQKA